MKTKLLTTAVLAFGVSFGAQASLVARDGGMVYDTVNNITWAADANLAQTSGYDADGKMTWAEARAWADQLTLGGYTDWALPTTVPAVLGFNQTGSQMGNLFYTQLGGVEGTSITATHNANYNLFSNVQSYTYWSGSEYAPNPNLVWDFSTLYGIQGTSFKHYQYYAWAVRPGDVAASSVPVPAAPRAVPEDFFAPTFQFFMLDAKKAKPITKTLLAQTIAPIIPFYLTTDKNQTAIKIPGATFGTNQLYSYANPTSLPEYNFADKNLKGLVKQKFLVNFRSPVGLIPGGGGQVVHVHFTKAVNYFGAWFGGRTDLVDFSLVDTIRYVVNGQAVDTNVQGGFPKFIGVEDSVGFTDLDIVPIGGATQSYYFDKPSFR